MPYQVRAMEIKRKSQNKEQRQSPCFFLDRYFSIQEKQEKEICGSHPAKHIGEPCLHLLKVETPREKLHQKAAPMEISLHRKQRKAEHCLAPSKGFQRWQQG